MTNILVFPLLDTVIFHCVDRCEMLKSKGKNILRDFLMKIDERKSKKLGKEGKYVR